MDFGPEFRDVRWDLKGFGGPHSRDFTSDFKDFRDFTSEFEGFKPHFRDFWSDFTDFRDTTADDSGISGILGQISGHLNPEFQKKSAP